jgi:hypothetical protein
MLVTLNPDLLSLANALDATMTDWNCEKVSQKLPHSKS